MAVCTFDVTNIDKWRHKHWQMMSYTFVMMLNNLSVFQHRDLRYYSLGLKLDMSFATPLTIVFS